MSAKLSALSLLGVAFVMLNAARVSAAADFIFTDEFAKYPAGSDGSPAWSSGGMGWEVRNGVFTCADRGKDQALVDAAPCGGEVVVQADIKLREGTGKGWKVAGLCVVLDPANFWHLALVEGPDEQGKRHFVELTEMHQGTWLAQTQAATKLQQKDSQGQSFNWAHDHTYRLVLELNAAGITGQVQESDGTVRAKIGYAFGQAPVVTCGKPGLAAGGFHAEFTAFSTKVGQPVPVEKTGTKWPSYDVGPPARLPYKGKATGFFHVEQAGDTWWTVDPAGNAFFIIGTDHANYQCHWCEKLSYAPYNRNCEKKYGGEAKWADSTLARLKAWGFNSLGTNASPSLRRRGLPHPEFLSVGTGFTDHDYITAKTTWTGFPNVFSPKWQAYCEKQAQRLCAPLKDDPWVLGYFLDNELEWHPWTGTGLFGDTFKKPADHSAKRALVELLKQRHPTPADFNTAWGTTIASFDDLLALNAAPAANTAAAKADMADYTRLVAEKYFAISSAAVRKYDPNHMVLGCRFAGYAPEIVDVAGKYCDIFSINCYRNVDLERGVMSDNFEEDLRRWHEQSKRPMMITEWSFPALDAGLPCKHGAGQRVPTQADKAFCFTVFQKLLFSTPFMVGSNYFMWADEPALGISSTFPEDSNYGLVNENDEPYELLTQAATKLHPLVYDIHSGKMTDFYVMPGNIGVIVVNAGSIAARAKVTLWTDGQPQTSELEVAAGKTQDIMAPPDSIAKPGVHALVCRVEPDSPLLEKNPSNNSLTHVLYVPGLPWAEAAQGAKQRIPLLVANPSDKPLERAVVAVKVADLLPGQPLPEPLVLAALDTETGKPPPVFQLDHLEDDAQLVLSVSDLGPRCARTFFLYLNTDAPARGEAPVKCRGTATGFEVDNGVLKLVKDNPKSGNAFDRISLRGLELGRFTPLVHQATGQNMWVGPDRIEEIEEFNGPVRLVLDMTFARGTGGGGETKTQVNDAGKPAPAQTREKQFRTKYRFIIEPNREWFTSQLMWIENTDATPWELASYYHYLPSNIGGDAKDDEPRGDHWFDPGTKTCFGIVPGAPLINVYFWKDPGGGEHPDAARKLNITLQPRERYAKSEPVAYVVGSKEDAWKETSQRLRNQSAIIWRAFPPERK
ncbi:MAG: beta-galactosidase [Planctomycetota bacterium]|nr:beta-galactosidase [Planctomycetota bacterium]